MINKDNKKEVDVTEVKRVIDKQRNYPIYKANDIIQRARYDLNITELKTFAFILSKIKPDDKFGQEYSFSIKEYCQICGLDYKNGGNYKHIKDILKSLRDKSFWLITSEGKETTIGWLAKVTTDRRNGNVAVKLDEDIQKYVIGLKGTNNFTQYNLISTLPMKSSYSFRIYELLKSYAYINEYRFDIDDLKSKLAATNYVNFKDFRKKVIEIAIKEINEYTDIHVTWNSITKGKKVIAIEFKIETLDGLKRYYTGKQATSQIEGQINIEDYYK